MLVAAAFSVIAACAGQTDNWSVTVGEIGSSRSDGFMAVAAMIRVEGREPFGPIRLRVSFRDAGGAVVDETNDSLPYCATDTECWWAASFPLDQFDRSDAIKTAEVRVLGTPTQYSGEARVEPFDVSRRADGRVQGKTPGDEGYVYLVGFDDGQVRGGVFSSVTPESDRDVYFPPSGIAALGRNAELHAYFYALRVPKGS
jgi:hypothetical protein